MPSSVRAGLNVCLNARLGTPHLSVNLVSSRCHCEVMEHIEENNQEMPGRLGVATQPSVDEGMKFSAFLAGLRDLTLLDTSEAVKKKKEPTLCPACEQLTFSWRPGKLRWRQVEETATRLECPLCQMLIDCLPLATSLGDLNTAAFSKGPKISLNTTHAVLKVGRLDEYMDRILEAGAYVEDPSTGSHCAFQMAAAWMTVCLTQHHKCTEARKFELPFLPTRVIDVGPSSGAHEVKLHSSANQRGLYFTLSYRWSQEIALRFQTVKSNIDAYKMSIPVLKLPQIMRDAILITRRLGVRYLWIDALCIIQDSEEDWQAEAGEMARIYTNSLLTIAAAADATNYYQGCFRPRTRRQTRPFSTKTPWPSGVKKYIFADRRMTHDGARSMSVLDTRAWVLQEQLLSPRVLTYSNGELYWDCTSVNASESFPSGIPSFYDANLKLQDARQFKEAIISRGRTMTDRRQLYTSWQNLVESYTERKMTKEADKMAALLGVANAAAVVFEDEILAGLWKKRLWRDLLWWVKEPEKSHRLVNFTAPTWSWASLNAPISYDLWGRDTEEDIHKSIVIIDVVAYFNSTLSAISGKIFVCGKVVAMMDSPANVSAPSWREDISGTSPARVKCLIVAVSMYYVYALALVKVDDEDNVFRRVGIVDWRTSPTNFGWVHLERKWNSQTKLVTVTIV